MVCYLHNYDNVRMKGWLVLGGNCCCNANEMLEGMVLWHATRYLLLPMATANSVIWE